jgi:hypothetical protein
VSAAASIVETVIACARKMRSKASNERIERKSNRCKAGARHRQFQKCIIFEEVRKEQGRDNTYMKHRPKRATQGASKGKALEAQEATMT